MTVANDYRELHELTPAQAVAVLALAAGATHRQAAEAAGVNRVTVTKWSSHHPRFIAELNRLRTDAADEASVQIARITLMSLGAIEDAIGGGSIDAAFRWAKIVSPLSVTVPPSGPVESVDVIEAVRQAMPSPLMEALRKSSEQRTAADAEQLITARLKPDIESMVGPAELESPGRERDISDRPAELRW